MSTSVGNISQYCRSVLMGAFAFCLLVGGTSMSVRADSQIQNPIEVNISVDSNSKIALGEPITLRYRITNVSNQGIGVDLGAYKTQWYRFNLTDASAQSAQVIPDERPINPIGFHSTGTYFLPPKGHEEDYLVVTRFFRILHPGKYSLTVRVDVPYASGTDTAEVVSPSDLESDVKLSNETLTKTFVFPFIVTEASAAQLEAAAAALGRAAMIEKDRKKYQSLLDALFSMPETQSASTWESLASDPGKMNAEMIADNLARVHSVKAVDLLIKMLDNTTISSDAASFIRTKIDESYNSGDATVKKHIKQIAANRGAIMPEKVLLPQITD